MAAPNAAAGYVASTKDARRAPSPLNGERAGMRGENGFGARIDKQLAKLFRLSVSEF